MKQCFYLAIFNVSLKLPKADFCKDFAFLLFYGVIMTNLYVC